MWFDTKIRNNLTEFFTGVGNERKSKECSPVNYKIPPLISKN